jgi:hypothetical protein
MYTQGKRSSSLFIQSQAACPGSSTCCWPKPEFPTTLFLRWRRLGASILAISRLHFFVCSSHIIFPQHSRTMDSFHRQRGPFSRQHDPLKCVAFSLCPRVFFLEFQQVNEEMDEYDLILVIGANDTVNSAAEDDPNCEIYGMPVCKIANAPFRLFCLLSVSHLIQCFSAWFMRAWFGSDVFRRSCKSAMKEWGERSSSSSLASP